MMTVYHGSVESVPHPLCNVGRVGLDFGRGFYVTAIETQAVGWARAVAFRRGGAPVLNVYELDREALLAEGRCRLFTAYDGEWLSFIVQSRMGLNPAAGYDYVEGGVANDRVIDTVNLFMAGLLDERGALQRLAFNQPNNQICLLSQTLTDKHLHYVATRPIH